MGSHSVSTQFNSTTATAAVNARWARYRAGQSIEKHQANINEWAKDKGLTKEQVDPLIYFASVMSDPSLDHTLRMAAAAKLMPYLTGPAPKEPSADDPNAAPTVSDADRMRANREMFSKLIEATTGKPVQWDEPLPGEVIDPADQTPVDGDTTDGHPEDVTDE